MCPLPVRAKIVRTVIIAMLAGVVVFAGVCMMYSRMGLTLLQPPVDTSSTKIELAQSKLFSEPVLRKGARHIENDVSFMRGCAIDAISYREGLPDDVRAEQRDKIGAQATYTMTFHCDSFNEQTQSMGKQGSYEYRLLYDPSRSRDGTGWLTLDYGNG